MVLAPSTEERDEVLALLRRRHPEPTTAATYAGCPVMDFERDDLIRVIEVSVQALAAKQRYCDEHHGK